MSPQGEPHTQGCPAALQPQPGTSQVLAPGQLSNSCHPGLHPLTCVGKGARSVSPGLAGPEALLELAQLKSPEWEKSQFSPSRPRPRGLEEEPVVGFCHRRALSGPLGLPALLRQIPAWLCSGSQPRGPELAWSSPRRERPFREAVSTSPSTTPCPFPHIPKLHTPVSPGSPRD